MSCNCDIEKFKERVDYSIARIKDKINDKEQNNPYFLTLYELPYIFCDGKIIAGFLSDNDCDSSLQNGLIKQPLNTLHLTERVIGEDHFCLILKNCTFIKDNMKDKEEYKKIADGVYYVQAMDNGEDFNKNKLLNYFSLIPVEKNSSENGKPQWSCYIEGQENDIKIYLLKISIKGIDYPLYIFWSDGKTEDHGCLEGKSEYFAEGLKNLVSNEETSQTINNWKKDTFFTPFYYKTDKKSLKETIDFSSIERWLISRDYFDETLDNITSEINQIVAKSQESPNSEGNNKGFKSFFMRTKRSDVNYFSIQVTPKMLGLIYKEVEQMIDKKEVENELRKIFIDAYAENVNEVKNLIAVIKNRTDNDYYDVSTLKDSKINNFTNLVKSAHASLKEILRVKK